ncbi:MAG: glycosyltransferase family 8 protein [Acidocella sp.]|nr:glycosyltransferase family 8 protein [Acidocella sp.]
MRRLPANPGKAKHSVMKCRNAVFFASDAAYLPLAWVAARAASAEPGRNFDVVLLAEHEAARTLIAPPGVIMRHVALPANLAALAGPAHMSAFTYARLAAADVWLSDYDRLLYIDSDTRITGPLSPLFTLDLHGALIAGAEDCGRYLGTAAGREDWDEYRAATGLPRDRPYYNSGVMLMDAAQWRAEGTWQAAQDFIADRPNALRFMDQDVLNVLAAGRIAELSPRWNFMTHYMALGLEPVIAPHILHYANVLKPWRDPEWATLYGDADSRAFAALFAGTPWPHLVPSGLYRTGFWRMRAARRAALRARHVPPGAIAGHVANFTAMAARLKCDVRAGIKDGLDRYIDVTDAEKAAWHAALTR